MTRALIKSFRLSEDTAKVNQMKEVVDAIWPIFDMDGSGASPLTYLTPRAAKKGSSAFAP